MSIAKQYRGYQHNHYVPVWYQKRFLGPDQTRYWYLDLKPEVVTSGSVRHTRRDLLHWAPASCFAQDNLYTTTWGDIENTEIEQFFFGELDQKGKPAVEYFRQFEHPSADNSAFRAFMRYMSVQKLRTPKALGYLQTVSRTDNRNITLQLLQKIQSIYCAIWIECVWQIADASQSPTKFIISDHPVTVYNRECFPLSERCAHYNDPDIRLVATHTYFPLSLEKILILTNLSWVRDPYQSELATRPNRTSSARRSLNLRTYKRVDF
jgi:hypothetical protein